MPYYQYFVIISFQRSTFNLPSLVLFLCTSLYSLYSENLYFKFIFSLSNLFHSVSHLIKFCYFTATFLTYKNSCILPCKNKKSLQFSSPISFRLILHSHFGILDYSTSVHVSKAVFQLYRWLYRHSAPLYIMVQWLWYTHTSDTVSSSTSHNSPIVFTLCVWHWLTRTVLSVAQVSETPSHLQPHLSVKHHITQ